MFVTASLEYLLPAKKHGAAANLCTDLEQQRAIRKMTRDEEDEGRDDVISNAEDDHLIVAVKFEIMMLIQMMTTLHAMMTS